MRPSDSLDFRSEASPVRGDVRGGHVATRSPLLPVAIGADTEQTFWTRTASGLTALSHFNCWAAAKELVVLYQSIIQPLQVDVPDASTAMLKVVLEEATSPLAYAAHDAPTSFRNGHSWPLTYPEARDWLILLIHAYKETIRTFWTLASYDDAAVGGTNVLVARCFALVASCDELVHAVELHRDILSWHSCSVVLPAYNEAENIGETVEHCVDSLRRICPNFQVIVVNDGSRDATGAIANQAAAQDASILVVHNNPNKGYGGALLAGFAAAEAERIFFMDSDGQFDIREIATLLQLIESGKCQVAIGYRAKRSDPFMRKLNAWGWKLAARHVAGLTGIRDIDCAFKLFPTNALRACRLIAQGASVNVEMLLKFQHMGLQIGQTPVKHMPRTKGSPTGAKPQVILRAFRELFRLRRHMRAWAPQERLTSTHLSKPIVREAPRSIR